MRSNYFKAASRLSVFGAGLLALALCSCRKAAEADRSNVPSSPPVVAGASTAPVKYSYEVVHRWPHDPAAFTQGLVFRNGEFLESTGLNGRSSLRNVDLTTGRVLHKKSLPAEYFAEGLAVIGAKAFQLTWKNGKGFIYDSDTFETLGDFAFDGEGWGLTTDGALLILSDGTARLRFIDPATFREVRTIEVVAAGKPVPRLNELEWVNGEIFANVWRTDTVVRIDPASGVVRGIIDFAHLLPSEERGPESEVLNGIAYDPAGDRLFVTGKCWPTIFEVRLKALAP